MFSTLFFWVALILISSWVFPRFYFKRDDKLVGQLKVTSFLLEAVALALLFFPWIPARHGGDSGLDLALAGDLRVTVFILLIVCSFVLLALNNKFLLKVGATLHFVATVYFFVLMVVLFPDSMALVLTDIAPIILALVLLVCNVSVLLLWHQLQKKGSRVRLSSGASIASLLVAILIVILGVKVGGEQFSVEIVKEEALLLVTALPEVIEYQSILEDAGVSFETIVEDWDSDWGVQVFEIVDDGESSHSATFGWFTVNKKSGKVSRSI